MEADLLATILSAPFFAAAIRSAAPIMGAAAGEAIYERSGVVNIGLEGMMLMGAFCGVLGSMYTGSAWGGALFAVAGGVLVGIVHAVICISFRADQILAGIAVNFGVLGLTAFLSRSYFGPSPDPVRIFAPTQWPLLSSIPFVGDVFFRHIPLVYIIALLCVLAWAFLFFTLPGLRLRAVGENPFAARAAGIGTVRYAYAGAVICGAMAGLSGACYSIGSVQYFSENMTASNGFIALAVVIVARRNPLYAIGASFVFAIGTALALRLQGRDSIIPYEFFLMLPYVLTLIIYGALGRRGKVEAARA